MRVKQAVDDYRYAILHLADKTQREYLSKLIVFAAWCDRQGVGLGDIKQATICGFMEALKERGIVAATQHGYMRVVKRFLHWLDGEEGYEGLVSSRVVSRMEMPKVPIKVIEVFSAEQIRALFAACEQEYNQELRVRDRAIISVLVDTGIRASELVGLMMDCVFVDPLDAHLKVYGKGQKWREVALGKHSLIALRRYITRYRQGDDPHVFHNRYDQ